MLMIDKLIDNIKLKNNPLCIGLDTTIDIIPKDILDSEINERWFTPRAYTSAMGNFNKKIIDIVYKLIPAIIINIKYYEKYGVAGLRTFIETINYAKTKGLIIIADINRSEYDEAYLGKITIDKTKQSYYNSDFITANPYLGIDSISKYVDDCLTYEKGMFVLLKVTNGTFNELIVVDPDNPDVKEPLYHKLAKDIDELGSRIIGVNNFSSVGSVIGSLHSTQLLQLRTLHPKMFFILAENKSYEESVASLIPAFNSNKLGALIIKSNRILTAYKNPVYNGLSFEKAIEEETKAIITNINLFLHEGE